MVRTATGIRVIRLIDRMSRPMSLLRVGSPEPEKVMTSIFGPEATAALIWARISRGGKNLRRRTVVFPVEPSWQ